MQGTLWGCHGERESIALKVQSSASVLREAWRLLSEDASGAVSCTQTAWFLVEHSPGTPVTLRDDRCLAMPPGPLAPVTATASHSPLQRGVWPSVM